MKDLTPIFLVDPNFSRDGIDHLADSVLCDGLWFIPAQATALFSCNDGGDWLSLSYLRKHFWQINFLDARRELNNRGKSHVLFSRLA